MSMPGTAKADRWLFSIGNGEMMYYSSFDEETHITSIFPDSRSTTYDDGYLKHIVIRRWNDTAWHDPSAKYMYGDINNADK